MNTPANCPIAQCQVEIAQLSLALIRQVRTARRMIKRRGPCARCETDPDACPVLAAFDQAVDIALQQIADEWNLGEPVTGSSDAAGGGGGQ